MTGKYKVRFHLGKGPNYRHWQVISPKGDRTFYDPDETFIFMENAKLHNNCKTARQIHAGRNKTVCARITCDNLEARGILNYLFSESPSPTGKTQIHYNPRKNPHWIENGENVDFKRYKRLFTHEDRVLVED